MSNQEQEGHHGWSPDVGAGESKEATEANLKAFGEPPEESGKGREPSDEERSGMPPADPEPGSPHGVGESTTTPGEEYGEEGEKGRETVGTKGESERPYGTSDQRTSTGVDPQDPIDPESPNLPRG
jgi:hypothetical protein